MSASLEGFRLSGEQRRLLRARADRPAARAQCAVWIEGELRADALRAAIEEVVGRHESLRTSFQRLPEMLLPIQVIGDPGPVELPSGAWTGLSADEIDSRVLAWMEADREAPLDPARAPLVTFSLRAAGDRLHVLLVSAPALVADERSLEILVADLAAAYARPGVDREPPIQYADYSEWCHERAAELAEDPAALAARRRWSAPEGVRQLELPWRGAGSGGRGPLDPTAVAVPLAPGLGARLEALAEARGTSADALLLAAFQVLLARLARSAEVPLRLWLDGRAAPELEGGVGAFERTLPLVARVDAGRSIVELARDAAAALGDARADQALVPVEEEADAGAVIFASRRAARRFEAGDAVFEIRRRYVGGDPCELKLVARWGEGSLELELQRGGSAPPEWGERAAGCLGALLAEAVARPDAPAGDLEVLGEAEARRVVSAWNETAAPVSGPLRLDELFEAQVARAPEAEALVYKGEALSFGELDRRAGALAALLRAEGVGPDVIVGVYLERSLALVVAALGVLKAGGAFLPLDIFQPPERTAAILTDAGAPLVLTQPGLAGQLAAPLARAVLVDPGGIALDAPAPEAAAPPAAPGSPGDLAYVIYTSGSTGTPKGVMIEHRSAANLLSGLRRAVYEPTFGGGERRLRVSLNAPLSFDSSIKQLIMLLDGHCLHVIEQELRRDGQAMLGYLERHRLDVLDCTPSQLKLLAWAGFFERPEIAPGLVLLGGEAIDRPLWDRARRFGASAFYNVYGPTECTVDTTVGRIGAGDEEPHIGAPIANVRVYLLDDRMKLVPPGVSGEVCIAGAGLARGYLGSPALTSERFPTWTPPAGLGGGERIYRSGDLGRHLPDGRIAFVGRVDDQLKIRGYRVEVGEVEEALRAHPAVREVAVLSDRDPAGNTRLVAYVVPRATATADGRNPVSSSELRRHLSGKVPDYMVPAAFMTLDALPLSPNGKVDRQAVPTSPSVRPALNSLFVAPQSEVERVLAGIWEELLHLEQIGTQDNFFDLGGHSLLLPQVQSAAAKELGVEVALAKLLEHPTIAALAAFIGEALPQDDTAREALAHGERQREARQRARRRAPQAS